MTQATPFLTIIGLDLSTDMIFEEANTLLSKHLNKDLEMEVKNTGNETLSKLGIYQTVYEIQAGYELCTATIAGDDIVLAEYLNGRSVYDLLSDAVSSRYGADDDIEITFFDNGIMSSHVASYKDSSKEDVVQTAYTTLIAVEVEDSYEYFAAVLTKDAPLYLKDGKNIVIEEDCRHDERFDLILGTIIQAYLLDLKDNIDLVEEEYLHVGYATMHDAGEYEKFIGIRDVMFYAEKNSLSQVYQIVKQRFPLETIESVSNVYDNSVPALDVISYNYAHMIPMIVNQLGISKEEALEYIDKPDMNEDGSVDIHEDYDAIIAVGVLENFYEDDAEEALKLDINSIAVEALGFSIIEGASYSRESLIDGIHELSDANMDELDIDFDDTITFPVADIAVNVGYPEWVRTLLIPFIRIQMAGIEDIDDLDNKDLIKDFVDFIGELK